MTRELAFLDRINLKDFVAMLDAALPEKGMLELTPEMEVDRMLAQDQLTLAQLNELAAAGFIETAQGMAEFLAPGVHWIAPTEYGQEFSRLTAMGDYE